MALGTEVGLGPRHIVLDGDPASLPKRERSPPPQLSAHVHCGQTAGWIKMSHGTEVGWPMRHCVSALRCVTIRCGTLRCVNGSSLRHVAKRHTACCATECYDTFTARCDTLINVRYGTLLHVMVHYDAYGTLRCNLRVVYGTLQHAMQWLCCVTDR